MTHERALVEIGYPAQERRVGREPLERNDEREWGQKRVNGPVPGAVEDERVSAAAPGDLDRTLGRSRRLVSADQENHVGAGPLERLDAAVPGLRAFDHGAVDPDLLHEHRQCELVGEAIEARADRMEQRGREELACLLKSRGLSSPVDVAEDIRQPLQVGKRHRCLLRACTASQPG